MVSIRCFLAVVAVGALWQAGGFAGAVTGLLPGGKIHRGSARLPVAGVRVTPGKGVLPCRGARAPPVNSVETGTSAFSTSGLSIPFSFSME